MVSARRALGGWGPRNWLVGHGAVQGRGRALSGWVPRNWLVGTVQVKEWCTSLISAATIGARSGKVGLHLVSAVLCEGVQVAHEPLEPLFQHVGVDLRGRNVGMAQQRLHDPQVGAVVQ